MKKTIMGLAITCLCVTPLTISAKSMMKTDTEIISSFKHKRDGDNAFTYYSIADNKTYKVETKKNTINIYDMSSKKLLASAKVDLNNLSNSEEDNVLSFGYMDLISSRKPYDSWGNFVFLQNTHLHIGKWTNITIGVLTSMFTAWLGFGVIAGGASGFVQSVASEVYNNRYGISDAYARQYIASNRNCNILDKFKNQIYSDANYKHYVATGYTVSWLGSPNDPGTDERCRDVSRYW